MCAQVTSGRGKPGENDLAALLGVAGISATDPAGFEAGVVAARPQLLARTAALACRYIE